LGNQGALFNFYKDRAGRFFDLDLVVAYQNFASINDIIIIIVYYVKNKAFC
jgi:hypothetical protein